MKADLNAYQFHTVWKKGKEHRIPDALSRSPVNEPTPEDLDDEQELYGCIATIARIHAAAIERDMNPDDDEPVDGASTDLLLRELQEAARSDDEYQALLTHLQSGTDALPERLRIFKHAIPELSIAPENVILYRQRLLIPRTFRREVLKRLHASHQGINRSLRRARQSIYWPGMTSDVTSTIEACDACQTHLPSQAQEPSLSDTLPTRVFEHIAADFFESNNKHYLAMVDRYSGYPLIAAFTSPPTAAATIDRLKQVFTTFGCPTRLFTDGGRQFTAQETQDFLQRWGVAHRLSTAHYPQSNGLAESAVKALKTLLVKTRGRFSSDAFNEGLLELRNTPRAGGKSPAEIVFGHPVRSRLPVHHSAFDERWLVAMEAHDHKMSKLQEQAHEAYDKQARKLPYLAIDALVRLQDPKTKLWDKTGIIVSRGRFRDYRVRLPSGRCYWRNRRFIRPAHPPAEDNSSDEESPRPAEAPTKTSSAEKKEADDPKTVRRSKRVKFAPQRLTY